MYLYGSVSIAVANNRDVFNVYTSSIGHTGVLGILIIEKNSTFKLFFFCVISNINFDGNDGGEIWKTKERPILLE